MRKSPFSTPRGAGNRPGFGWQSHEYRNNRGYDNNRRMSQNFYPSNPNSMSMEVGNSDFIPFNSTPNNYDRSNERHFHGRSRGRGNWGAHHHEGNSPRAHFHNYAPYNARGRGRPRGKGGFQSNPRSIPISEFLDIASALEDPWKDLIDNMDKSTIKEDKDKPENISMDSSQLNDDNLVRKEMIMVQ